MRYSFHAQIDERKRGSERFTAMLQGFEARTILADFGDPVRGDTSIITCVYDEAGDLVGELSVPPGGTCDGKPCWRTIPRKGLDYRSRAAADDGVWRLQALSGDTGKGKLQIQAGNKASKGQNAMPTGTAAALKDADTVWLKVFASDAECFEATLDEAGKADGARVSARASRR